VVRSELETRVRVLAGKIDALPHADVARVVEAISAVDPGLVMQFAELMLAGQELHEIVKDMRVTEKPN
jgi:hypothetical protein